MSISLQVAIESLPLQLYPPKWESAADAHIGRQLYEPLLELSSDLQLAPCLANEYFVDNSHLEYLIHLHPITSFSDGTPCDAEALVWNLEQRAASFGLTRDKIQNLSTIGRHGIRIRLKNRDPFFLHRFAQPQSSFVSPSLIQDHHPLLPKAGTGPFQLDRISKEGLPVLRRRSNTGNDKFGMVDEITFRVLENGQDMLSETRAGKVDVIYECPYKELSNIGVTDDLVLSSTPSLSITSLIFNCQSKRWKNPEERYALASAISAADLLKEGNHGVGNVAQSLVPAHLRKQVDTNLNLFQANSRAKAVTMTVVREHSPSVLVELERQLNVSGYPLNFVLKSVTGLRESLKKGNFEVALAGFSFGGPDARAILRRLFHSSSPYNVCGFSNKQCDSILNMMQKAESVDHIRDLASNLDSLLRNECPMFPLREGLSIIINRPEWKGLHAFPDGILRIGETFKPRKE